MAENSAYSYYAAITVSIIDTRSLLLQEITLTTYTHSTSIALPIEQAIEKLQAVMQVAGLGIVSDVDVQKTIKTKLNEDIAPYRILGACNPVLAKKLIEAVPQAGALLPCTVIARETNGVTAIDFMAPEIVLGLEKHPIASAVGKDAAEKINKVINELEN